MTDYQNLVIEQLNNAHKLPRHAIPATLIGQLAVSQHAQGVGVGKMLRMDTIKRTLGVSN